MTPHDPIDGLTQLGYTEREAAFLYEVVRHSGYFLRRQYARFLQRQRGGLLQDFLSKAQRLGHLEVLDCGQRRFLYHLKSKLIYRLAGAEDSQNRRSKGDDQIKIRLMILDYVLGYPRQYFLALAEEKVEFFTQTLHMPRTALPRDPFAATPVRYFVDRFPIAISPAPKPVSFTYFDQGSCTIKPFSRYLKTYAALFAALKEFELRYIAMSITNFRAARNIFEREYSNGKTTDQRVVPFGADHLLRFFQAERLWDDNSPELNTEHIGILREGEKVYCRPEHRLLRDSWRAGKKEFARALASLGICDGAKGTLITQVIRETYPLLGYRRAQPGTNSQVAGAVGGVVYE